jgi:hypothetical protein
LIVEGVHYGLTLLYSYLLPVFNIEETPRGFVFEVDWGLFKGFRCVFDEESLVTECSDVPSELLGEVSRLLGLDKRIVFSEVCRLAGLDRCVAGVVTLIYSPRYKLPVAYSIYLSRNTDYYINTVRWVREALSRGVVESSAYIPREFNRVKSLIDQTLLRSKSPVEEALDLLEIKGFGVKSAKAYLLHAYGLTEHAPIDRHYLRVLGVKPAISKSKCISTGKLDCLRCSVNCAYRVATARFRELNGAVQSLAYIYGRLKSKRRSSLEEVLVKSPDYYIDHFEALFENLTSRDL